MTREIGRGVPATRYDPVQIHVRATLPHDRFWCVRVEPAFAMSGTPLGDRTPPVVVESSSYECETVQIRLDGDKIFLAFSRYQQDRAPENKTLTWNDFVERFQTAFYPELLK